jgi:predicted dinucleotide-binding enzyme
MKFGVLGTGIVGQVLGKGFADLGHEVKMGSRDARNEKLKEWVAKSGSRASGGTFAEAASFGEVILVATAWSGTENAIKQANPKNFANKVVIDATNPLVVKPNSPPGLALGYTDSAGEQVQRWLMDARVVKAFNTIGNAHMIKPSFPGGPPDHFICGNDDGAKKVVTDICKALGWPGTIDIGGIEGSRLLEPLALLWIGYGIRTGGWGHAWKMLRK